MENQKLYKELKAEQKRLKSEVDKIMAMLDPINKLIAQYTPEDEMPKEATVKPITQARRKSNTDVQGWVLESLQYITRGTVHDVLKVFKEFHPEIPEETALNAVKTHLSLMGRNNRIHGEKAPGKNYYIYTCENQDAVNQ